MLDAFRQGLRELGYIEGQHIDIEYRSTDDGLERAPGFAADLVNLNVDVLVTTGVEATTIAKQATDSIPIVGAILGPDPVGAGFAAGLARPGGNITGLSATVAGGITSKQLEILPEVAPGMRRLAILWNANNPAKGSNVQEAEVAAGQFGVQIECVEIRAGRDMDGALRTIAESRPDALMVLQDPLTAGSSVRITAFAVEQRLPAIYEVRLWTDAVGLMHYGPNTVELVRRAASYVDRILNGARPADLPIEQPTVFELTINLKVAQAI